MRKLILLLIGLLTASTVQAQELVFERFEDTNFSSRGWYDGSMNISTDDCPSCPGNNALLVTFVTGASTPSGSNGMRILFTPTDSIMLSYWVKYSSNWQGSGDPFHPHEFLIMTTLSPPFVGPGFVELGAYVEHNVENGVGIPMIRAQDSENIDQSQINVDLIGITENRSVHGCNGSPNAATITSLDCYASGSIFLNGAGWSPPASSINITDGQWHFVEAFFTLNTITNGIGNSDGYILYRVDNQVIMDFPSVMLRTGEHPTMQFNQLFVGFYIGSGSPIAQSVAVDDLKLTSVAPPGYASGPPPPPQQSPPEDITLWYNANSNIIVNQVMDKDIKPSPIALCDSLRAQYIYNRPLSFGVMDTISIVLLTTNTQGCTMFVPRTRHTLWMFKRYAFDNFNGNTTLLIPGSPAIILLNEIP